MQSQERCFSVNDYNLAAKEWNSGGDIKVLACHGWLDNAASFDVMAPLMSSCHIVALDSPGHGLSDHKSQHADYSIWADLLDILAVADELGWQQFCVLGHSRGAIMSMLLASAMPERLQAVAMIDALVPMPASGEEGVHQLRKYLLEYRAAASKKITSFISIDEAVTARCKASEMAKSSARLIVERGLKEIDGRYHWRTDPRLTAASALKFTEVHNRAFVEAISIPNLMLLAKRGLGKYSYLVDFCKSVDNLRTQMIDAGHHCHMEEQAADIAEHVERLFKTAVSIS